MCKKQRETKQHQEVGDAVWTAASYFFEVDFVRVLIITILLKE